ncbi:uncharacterized protein METZ01_LOCUS517479 [marine metagenome]|uniref:Uncharacterized protein n=1 Tax=marine metagenome TaxID=408172 RepID=A0A383F8A7_9ZZZZ
MSKNDKKKKLRLFTPPVPTREISLVCSRIHLKRNILQALTNSIHARIPQGLKQPHQKRKVVNLPNLTTVKKSTET